MSHSQPGKPLFKQIINKEFTLFIVARILFIAGLRMTPVLLGWRLYEITGSKLALGMLGLSEVIPAIALALPAGVRVDKSNKQRLLTICMTLYLLLMMALALITSEWMRSHYTTQVIEWSIYFIMAATGAVRAYSGAGFNAFLAQLVPADALVKAASINSMIWLTAAVAGPALAGLLMGYTNITIAFIPVLGLNLIAILLFMQIAPKPISWQGGSRTWEGVLEGVRFPELGVGRRVRHYGEQDVLDDYRTGVGIHPDLRRRGDALTHSEAVSDPVAAGSASGRAASRSDGPAAVDQVRRR